MKVLKFGGTSVGTAERIRNLALIIPKNEPVVVVLSAMSGTTNSLIEIAEEAQNGKVENSIDLLKKLEEKYYHTNGELFQTAMYIKRGEEFIRDLFYKALQKMNKSFNKKAYNEIVATGELLSTGLFHLYLTEQGNSSAFLPALNFMRVDKEHEPDYYYISENLQRELKLTSNTKLYITQGFICRNVVGEVDNLGRGGSDYSAAILGNVLNAEEVQIWTDIDGIHNNDPRFVDETSPLRELSFEEAAELAYFGAKILHPATIYPCSIKGIPVVLKNTLEPNDAGTLISKEYNPAGVKAVAAKDGITAIKIRSSRMLMAHGFLKKVFEIFDEFGTSVDMITTSEVAVSLTIDNQKNLDQIVNRLKAFSSVEVDENQTIICIVGDFVGEKPGSASAIFNTLKDVPVRMISYGGSSHNISILVNSHQKINALKAINQVVNQKVISGNDDN
jgi:aspartate kinase